MQEEITQKTLALCVEASKMTAQLLQQAMKKVLADMEKHKKNPQLRHGKQTLRQLMKHNTGVSNIEITDQNKQLYDSSAAFQSLKPVYDGLQKIKSEKPRAKYKAEHEAELKQFYAARRKLTGEFPDGKVDMKKLTEEYDELEQAHNTTYGEFKTVRDDLHRLWKVKSCVDTAARFNERTEEQMLQNRPQTRHKKEDISR